MSEKKLLSELTYEEAKELYHVNKWLGRTVTEYGYKLGNDFLSEILSSFDGVKSLRYEVGSGCGGDYIRVSQEYYKDFLEAVRDCNADYGIIDDGSGLSALADRMLKKADDYYAFTFGYQDISESRFDKLVAWFEAGIEKIERAIINYCSDVSNVDEDYALENWLVNNGVDYATDGAKIYEIKCRVYS